MKNLELLSAPLRTLPVICPLWGLSGAEHAHNYSLVLCSTKKRVLLYIDRIPLLWMGVAYYCTFEALQQLYMELCAALQILYPP